MTRSTVLLFAVAGFMIGCSPVQVRKEAKHVKVLAYTPQQLKHCQYMGTIEGESSASEKYKATDGAKNDLRNKAHKRGGNHVAIDGRDVKVLRAPMIIPHPTNTNIIVVYQGAIDYGKHVKLRGKVFHCKKTTKNVL